MLFLQYKTIIIVFGWLLFILNMVRCHNVFSLALKFAKILPRAWIRYQRFKLSLYDAMGTGSYLMYIAQAASCGKFSCHCLVATSASCGN